MEASEGIDIADVKKLFETIKNLKKEKDDLKKQLACARENFILATGEINELKKQLKIV